MTRVPSIQNVDNVPRGRDYAYHVTRSRNRSDIIRNGIRPQYRGPRGSKVDVLLQEHRPDGTGPSHRSDCVFLYPNADRGLSPAIEADNVCFIVDLTAVSAPMYTASYDAVSTLYTGSLESDAAVDAAREYWESCEPYSGGSTSGEILVEGSVPPSAIVGVFETTD